MDVLLIGGTGLISTGITRQLVEAGHDVTCFNRGRTDVDLPAAVEFVHGDRTDSKLLNRTAEAIDPDVVIDMVCFDAEQADAAVSAFADIAEQYIFCSTVDVYHRPLAEQFADENALRETEHDGAPVSEYGLHKAQAEDVFFAADGEAFASTIIRPWSTYGEGGPVLHTLGTDSYYVDRIRQGKPIIVHGDGTSLWGPCHRDDVAQAFVGAVGTEAAYGEAYHVTSEEPMTWNQYHRQVATALEAPEPELVHIPTAQLRAALPDRTEMLEDHFQFSTIFDNTKARRDLGFEYTVPFVDGIRRTIVDMESRDAIEPWDAANDDAVIDAWRAATERFRFAV